MMHLLSRATGSALQALGNPNDPAAAFAQDFLGSVMSGLPMPQARPAATRDAREATLALLDETFGNTVRDPRDTLLLAAGPDAGVWTESLSRSFDFGRGYAEGSGMSLLQTGEASSIASTFHSGRLNCERALFGGLAPPPFWIQSQPEQSLCLGNQRRKGLWMSWRRPESLEFRLCPAAGWARARLAGLFLPAPIGRKRAGLHPEASLRWRAVHTDATVPAPPVARARRAPWF